MRKEWSKPGVTILGMSETKEINFLKNCECAEIDALCGDNHNCGCGGKGCCECCPCS